MKDEIEVLILEVVKGKGNIDKLTREGITYPEIYNYIQISIEQGLIFLNEQSTLELTSLGYENLKALQKKLKRTIKKNWISPKNDSKIKQIDKNDIFLPSRNELFFD